MGTRYIIGELVTGQRIVNLPVLRGTWSDDLDSAESVSATVKLNNPVVRTLDLSNATQSPKTFLAAIDTGAFGQDVKVLAAGPIWDIDYNRGAQTLQLTAKGIRSIFDHRNVLPVAALTLPVNQWTVVDPADPSGVGTLPNPVVATTFSGRSLGGIAVGLVAQALSWPGGSLPINLPAVEAGTATITYQGAEFKKVGSALTDLTNRENGPEMRFPARLTTDGLGIVWDMEVGTTAEPLLYSDTVVGWNVTAKESPVSELSISKNGSNVAGISWATGGRANDTVLIARATNPDLVAAGYPLLEMLDSTHSDVVLQSTLNSYSVANLEVADGPAVTWTIDVKAHPLDKARNVAGPQLGDYNVGDFIRLHIDPYDDDNDRGDLFIPYGGDFNLRIVGISGDQDGDEVTIKCAPEVS